MADLDDFRARWLRDLNQRRLDAREQAHAAISALYHDQGRTTPALVWRPSPTVAADELGGPRECRDASRWRVAGQQPGESLARVFERALRSSLDRELSAQAGASAARLGLSHAELEQKLSFRNVHPTPLLLRGLKNLMQMHGELDVGHDFTGTWSSPPEFESGFHGLR